MELTPPSGSQGRRSFCTVGSLRPFSCWTWAPAPGTKGLAGPGDSLHFRGVILGLETLVSTVAFCKFASLPPRRHWDPILGLHVIPLCLSSLRFLKIHFSSFQLSHFPPPPPPLLLDTPGSRKEPYPKSLAPPAQFFSKCQTLRNVGTERSGLWPRFPFLPRLCQPLLSFLIKKV